jgi:hypothetical protein
MTYMLAITYSVALQPWRAQAAVNTVFEEQVANLLPQHLFESAWLNNQSHLVVKQENITGEEIWPIKHLMLCRVLLHAVLGIFITHKNPLSSVGFEPAEYPMGPVASMLTTRPPRAVSHLLHKYTKSGYGTVLTVACARQGCSATE